MEIVARFWRCEIIQCGGLEICHNHWFIVSCTCNASVSTNVGEPPLKPRVLHLAIPFSRSIVVQSDCLLSSLSPATVRSEVADGESCVCQHANR